LEAWREGLKAWRLKGLEVSAAILSAAAATPNDLTALNPLSLQAPSL
jgi:hypothetical protein